MLLVHENRFGIKKAIIFFIICFVGIRTQNSVNSIIQITLFPTLQRFFFFKQVHTTAGVTLIYLPAHTQNNIVNRHTATKLSLDITMYFINIHIFGILISPLQLNFYVTSKSGALVSFRLLLHKHACFP